MGEWESELTNQDPLEELLAPVETLGTSKTQGMCETCSVGSVSCGRAVVRSPRGFERMSS